MTDLYDPTPSFETSTARAGPEGGYRLRSEAIWAEVRDGYRWGFTAEELCERYDLGLSAFRARARREGWRRADQPDPAPQDAGLDPLDDDEPLASMEELLDLAWRHVARALRDGRVVEAQRWLRLHDHLARLDRPVAAAAEPDVVTSGMVPDPVDPAGRVVPDRKVQDRNVHDVHDVHPVFDRAQSPGDPMLEPAPDTPLNRADRRRMARRQRGRGPP